MKEEGEEQDRQAKRTLHPRRLRPRGPPGCPGARRRRRPLRHNRLGPPEGRRGHREGLPCTSRRGLRRARGLIVAVVFSARKINPNLHIVARASSDESTSKLQIVGADRAFSPYSVGGRRLASLATQPLIVDFLDIVTRGEQGIEFRLEEFGVPEESPLADHSIGELQIEEKTGAMVLSIRTSKVTVDTTPLVPGQNPCGRHPDRPRYPWASDPPRSPYERRRACERRLLTLPASIRNILL